MRVLGIETSCDETCAAVVDETGQVLSDVVHSQVELHRPYGGVVPELASRDHLRNVRPVVEAALARAGMQPTEIDGIAVTCRPGLTGALLVGVQVAQGLAFALARPLVGVDHLFGHLLAAFLRFPGGTAEPPPEFPFVALLVSGGHTALYRVDGPTLDAVQELGATRDDAAGEAFDKVAKLIGLGYPGGPIIDRLAKLGNPDGIELSLPMPSANSPEFSFSGLKTNVARYVEKHGLPQEGPALYDLCATFQRRVVETLVKKSVAAARREGVQTLVLGGGVAANRELRESAARACSKHGMRLFVPAFSACTDNGAMIAYAGALRLARGEDDTGTISTTPVTALAQVTRKGRGRRGVRLPGA
ncbi:MAG TPA: tRNA (adenosine(37)-N6)-threonylcarbamoyltransferase complex transferase subunit TsaD [Polyangiaceae bacterium]|nr:tRNA (adenosine(37)-N6)-threonylcarbamoyltransferase complex transferase subunit TsaD [Polyangiaceae bacterium]